MKLGSIVFFVITAVAVPGVQAAAIDTQVSVSLDLLGDVSFEEDARSSPGSVSACRDLLAAGFCGDPLPGLDSFASSQASTAYGANRAKVKARSLGSDLVASADALSFWSDEVSFNGVAPGDLIALRFRFDGRWNGASVDYGLGVFDPSLPPPVSDEGSLFDLTGHAMGMSTVAFAGFSSQDMAGLAFAPASGIQLALPAGSKDDGSIDWNFELRFSPVDGRTYTVASVLALGASISDIADVDPFTDLTPFGSAVSADFDSTAALTEIVLPAGVSLTSAAGAAYNVTAAVPEPGSWALLLAGLGLVGFVVRHRAA